MFSGCILILIIDDYCMFSTALGFPKGKRVTDHDYILEPKAVGFSKEVLPQ